MGPDSFGKKSFLPNKYTLDDLNDSQNTSQGNVFILV